MHSVCYWLHLSSIRPLWLWINEDFYIIKRFDNECYFCANRITCGQLEEYFGKAIGVQSLINVVESSRMAVNQSIKAFVLAATESQSQSSFEPLVYLFIVEICSVRRRGCHVSFGRNHPSHGGWVGPQSPAVLTPARETNAGRWMWSDWWLLLLQPFQISKSMPLVMYSLKKNAAFYIQIGRQSNSTSHHLPRLHNPFQWNALYYYSLTNNNLGLLNRPQIIPRHFNQQFNSISPVNLFSKFILPPLFHSTDLQPNAFAFELNSVWIFCWYFEFVWWTKRLNSWIWKWTNFDSRTWSALRCFDWTVNETLQLRGQSGIQRIQRPIDFHGPFNFHVSGR